MESTGMHGLTDVLGPGLEPLCSPEISVHFEAFPMLTKWFLYSLTSSFFEMSGALDCYMCSASSHNSSCFLEPTQQHTIECNSSFCQVWKLHSDVNGQVYMFERGCSPTCVPGCITLSDMENRFISCSSCCQTDGCNTDNYGAKASTQLSWLLCALVIFHCNVIDKIF